MRRSSAVLDMPGSSRGLPPLPILKSRLIFVLQLTACAFFSAGLLYPDFSACWGIIDDHEIMAFAGNQGHLGLGQIPQLLAKTEVVKIGQRFPRYRPAYYSLRLAETALWRNDPFLWYAFRVV